MWFLIKSGFSLMALAALAYFVFLVDVGGKPIAHHVGEIWTSEVVQEKVHLVKDGVQTEIEDRLSKAAADATREALRTGRAPGTHRPVDETDRAQLEALLKKENPEPKSTAKR